MSRMRRSFKLTTMNTNSNTGNTTRYKYNTFEDPHGTLPDNKSNPVWGAQPGESYRHTPVRQRPGICSTILDAIGGTPLVRLNRIPKEENIQCEILVKCEYLNPGGSIKDRIALRMIEEAEKDGVLRPGLSTVIEATGGNTGTGVALAAAVKGYKCVIVMPEKMSLDKSDLIMGLGGRIVRTPTNATFDDPRSHIQVARRLCKEIQGAVMLDQYRNPYNPVAHFDWTAEEILTQCDNKLDMLVATTETGGTVSGIARKIKAKLPSCIVVGVDHQYSILADPTTPKESNGIYYEVEGIGADFVPAVLNHGYVDRWERARDDEAFTMARRLIKSEGILCGGSSGCAVAAAIRAAKQLKEGQRCVVILPDAIRNYFSKFLTNEWMVQRDMMQRTFSEPATRPHWFDKSLSAIPLQPPIVLPREATFADAFAALAANPSMCYVLIDDKRCKSSFGSISSTDVLKAMTSAEGLNGTVDTPPRLPILSVACGGTLGQLHEILIGGRAPAVVLVDDWGVPIACVNGNGLLAFLQSLRNQSRREKACRRPSSPAHQASFMMRKVD